MSDHSEFVPRDQDVVYGHNCARKFYFSFGGIKSENITTFLGQNNLWIIITFKKKLGHCRKSLASKFQGTPLLMKIRRSA